MFVFPWSFERLRCRLSYIRTRYDFPPSQYSLFGEKKSVCVQKKKEADLRVCSGGGGGGC